MAKLLGLPSTLSTEALKKIYRDKKYVQENPTPIHNFTYSAFE